jgi:type I site-specific restriction endonuclease
MSQKSDYIGSNGKWSGFGSWKQSIFVKDQPTNHNKRRRASPIKPCPGAKRHTFRHRLTCRFCRLNRKMKKIRADGELGLFVRSLVGLDREAAKKAFSGLLDGKQWNANQIHFVNLVINDLTQNGWMSPARLSETPFTDFSPRGVEGVFNPD